MIGDQFDSCAFHEGELLAQAKAGLVEEARRVHPMVGPAFSPAAGPLLATMRLLVVSATDDEGRVWTTALTGPAGFLTAQGDLPLDVEASPPPMDPLAPALGGTVSVGLIAIDFARRRRVRVNGHATGRDGGLVVTAEQVYGNCPRYIQDRTPLDVGRSAEPRLLSR